MPSRASSYLLFADDKDTILARPGTAALFLFSLFEKAKTAMQAVIYFNMGLTHKKLGYYIIGRGKALAAVAEASCL